MNIRESLQEFRATVAKEQEVLTSLGERPAIACGWLLAKIDALTAAMPGADGNWIPKHRIGEHVVYKRPGRDDQITSGFIETVSMRALSNEKPYANYEVRREGRTSRDHIGDDDIIERKDMKP